MAILTRDCILLGGVPGSICKSMLRSESKRPKSCEVMSLKEGTGFLPKALVVKAFQSVDIVAGWIERRSRGEGRIGLMIRYHFVNVLIHQQNNSTIPLR